MKIKVINAIKFFNVFLLNINIINIINVIPPNILGKNPIREISCSKAGIINNIIIFVKTFIIFIVNHLLKIYNQ